MHLNFVVFTIDATPFACLPHTWTPCKGLLLLPGMVLTSMTFVDALRGMLTLNNGV